MEGPNISKAEKTAHTPTDPPKPSNCAPHQHVPTQISLNKFEALTPPQI